jgi:hypothetical protein
MKHDLTENRSLYDLRSRCRRPTGVSLRETLKNLFRQERKWRSVKGLVPLSATKFILVLEDGRLVSRRSLEIMTGWLHKGYLRKCLSRMMGNYHVRFLGGNGAVKPLTYPVGAD